MATANSTTPSRLAAKKDSNSTGYEADGRSVDTRTGNGDADGKNDRKNINEKTGANSRIAEQTEPSTLSDSIRLQRAESVLKSAQEAFAKTDSWVVAFRDLLGREGVVRRMFPDAASHEWFTETTQYAELQEMIAAMRSQDTSKGNAIEPERMITIRLPCSLHDVLADEAEASSLSVNKLCISKLIQPISSRFVPVQQGERRGRRPGPQISKKDTE